MNKERKNKEATKPINEEREKEKNKEQGRKKERQ